MARTTFGLVCILLLWIIILSHSYEASAARKLARNLRDQSCMHVNVLRKGGDYRRSLVSIFLPAPTPGSVPIYVSPPGPHP